MISNSTFEIQRIIWHLSDYELFDERVIYLKGCGGLYTEASGTIQTPTEEGKYPNDQTCIWTIQAPIGYIVQLSWLSFDLERNIRCRHDYVKVYENFMLHNREEIGTYVRIFLYSTIELATYVELRMIKSKNFTGSAVSRNRR